MCYLEMVTADKHHNDPKDFMEAEELLGKHFKHVQSRVFNMARLGAYTARHRYICWASNCDAPIKL